MALFSLRLAQPEKSKLKYLKIDVLAIQPCALAQQDWTKPRGTVKVDCLYICRVQTHPSEPIDLVRIDGETLWGEICAGAYKEVI